MTRQTVLEYQPILQSTNTPFNSTSSSCIRYLPYPLRCCNGSRTLIGQIPQYEYAHWIFIRTSPVQESKNYLMPGGWGSSLAPTSGSPAPGNDMWGLPRSQMRLTRRHLIQHLTTSECYGQDLADHRPRRKSARSKQIFQTCNLLKLLEKNIPMRPRLLRAPSKLLKDAVFWHSDRRNV